MGRNGVTINFSGLDDLVKGFSHQPAVIKNEATRIINTVAGKVEKTAYQNSPKDTGYLSQHIMAEPKGALNAQVIATANYSIYLEMGTRKAPAQPYMGPAVKAHEKDLYTMLSNLLKEGIR